MKLYRFSLWLDDDACYVHDVGFITAENDDEAIERGFRAFLDEGMTAAKHAAIVWTFPPDDCDEAFYTVVCVEDVSEVLEYAREGTLTLGYRPD